MAVAHRMAVHAPAPRCFMSVDRLGSTIGFRTSRTWRAPGPRMITRFASDDSNSVVGVVGTVMHEDETVLAIRERHGLHADLV